MKLTKPINNKPSNYVYRSTLCWKRVQANLHRLLSIQMSLLIWN